MLDTVSKIEEWAIAKGLDKAEPSKQMLKLIEEVGETASAIARNELVNAYDGIGDIFVVITILAMQLGVNIETCVNLAYDEIKDRQGKMVDGVFIKQEDLK